MLTNPAIVANVKVLQAATDAAIARAQETRHLFKGCAINWADLRCVEVEYFAGLQRKGYRVYIEELSPYNRVFQEFISGELSKLSFGSEVEVVMEW